jgi:tRNA pseudouridine38-40 synthase
MPTIRLTLTYDGSGFAGWQVQPGERTVQGVIESAITQLTGESIRILSTGRTDAGVHALGQVVSFRTASSIPAEKWRDALQSQLPRDVVVLDSQAAGDDFHATYSAKSKRYRYVILNRELDDPFLHKYVWRIKQPLDVAAMNTAAACLGGTHDFRAFESDGPNTASGVRTVSFIGLARMTHFPGWEARPLLDREGEAPAEPASESTLPLTSARREPRPPVNAGDFICLEIEADGFLYNMVRAIMGTLVNVGRGKWTPADVARILTSTDRTTAGDTAPPQGLYMVCARYEGD